MIDGSSQDSKTDNSPQQMELPLRGEVHTWEMKGGDLARSIRDVRVSHKPGAKLDFQITNSRLTSFHQTRDKQFSISCAVPIRESSCFQSESKEFSVDYGIAEKLMHASERWGSTRFRIEEKRKWALIEVDGCVLPLSLSPYSATFNPQPPIALGSLSSAQLRTGSRAASVFRTRRANRSAAKFNLTFRDGFAVHAYAYAVARHPVTTPHDMGVPGEHISNFLQVGARLRGSVALTETADQLRLHDSDGHSCSWLKVTTLLADMSSAFDAPDDIRIHVSTTQLQIVSVQLAAFAEELEIKTCSDARGPFLSLLGEFRGLPVTSRLPIDNFDVQISCTVKSEDLVLACCNLSNETLAIAATSSGLMLQGLGRDAAAQFLLRRFDTGR